MNSPTAACGFVPLAASPQPLSPLTTFHLLESFRSLSIVARVSNVRNHHRTLHHPPSIGACPLKSRPGFVFSRRHKGHRVALLPHPFGRLATHPPRLVTVWPGSSAESKKGTGGVQRPLHTGTVTRVGMVQGDLRREPKEHEGGTGGERKKRNSEDPSVRRLLEYHGDKIVTVGAILNLISLTMSDILWLRVFAGMSSSLSILFNVTRDPPFWYPAGWGILFLSINLGMIGKLLMERRDVAFSGEELEVYERFFLRHGLTPRQFHRLLKHATWLNLEVHQEMSRIGPAASDVLFVLSGEVEVASPKEAICIQGGHTGAVVGVKALLERISKSAPQQQQQQQGGAGSPAGSARQSGVTAAGSGASPLSPNGKPSPSPQGNTNMLPPPSASARQQSETQASCGRAGAVPVSSVPMPLSLVPVECDEAGAVSESWGGGTSGATGDSAAPLSSPQASQGLQAQNIGTGEGLGAPASVHSQAQGHTSPSGPNREKEKGGESTARQSVALTESAPALSAHSLPFREKDNLEGGGVKAPHSNHGRSVQPQHVFTREGEVEKTLTRTVDRQTASPSPPVSPSPAAVTSTRQQPLSLHSPSCPLASPSSRMAPPCPGQGSPKPLGVATGRDGEEDVVQVRVIRARAPSRLLVFRSEDIERLQREDQAAALSLTRAFAASLVARVRSQQVLSNHCTYMEVLKVMIADRSVSREEQEALAMFRDRYGVSEEQHEAMLAGLGWTRDEFEKGGRRQTWGGAFWESLSSALGGPFGGGGDAESAVAVENRVGQSGMMLQEEEEDGNLSWAEHFDAAARAVGGPVVSGRGQVETFSESTSPRAWMPRDNDDGPMLWDDLLSMQQKLVQEHLTIDIPIVFCGQKKGGKTSLVERFVMPSKGGDEGLSSMLSVALTPPGIARSVAVLVLDGAEPGGAFPALSFWLKELRTQVDKCVTTLGLSDEGSAAVGLLQEKLHKQWKDHRDTRALRPLQIPCVVVLSKWDVFKEKGDPERRKWLLRALRFLSHTNGAAFMCTSTAIKDRGTMVQYRAMLKALAFPSTAPPAAAPPAAAASEDAKEKEKGEQGGEEKGKEKKEKEKKAASGGGGAQQWDQKEPSRPNCISVGRDSLEAIGQPQGSAASVQTESAWGRVASEAFPPPPSQYEQSGVIHLADEMKNLSLIHPHLMGIYLLLVNELLCLRGRPRFPPTQTAAPRRRASSQSA
uniref:POPDC1-3 domain-containing protein n=1 Tax=Chromera velia CCMP2878 TaxID=1169474 RepID=A0A0G4HQJ2_9ALVE|eukprot:Cvel_7949.t1-p1 / transcript=Cvel_7949.t1 / gene=Cvel_7949 / organism=Chromera_velia_CCMP2878 / gene_product=Cytoplasmic dynein 2 light intermediate chain 1, putative / transcript_product=Cytoplasmic dynein 2 light intermediate chain 1, putative / location=Cvel_scaffold427:43145-57055(-) / protein_length=1204 / sequence_SO=supercontig / SO=protein_coding / is_pseudo=false